MKKRFLFLLSFLVFSSTLVFSQTEKTTQKSAGIQSIKFTMDAPTDKFLPDNTNKGFEWVEGNAKIQYTAIPGKYEDMSRNMEAMYSSDEMELLLNEEKKLAEKNGKFLKIKANARGEGQEDSFLLMFLMPHEKGIILLSASYPMSQDNDLYHKVVKSFDSFQEVK